MYIIAITTILTIYVVGSISEGMLMSTLEIYLIFSLLTIPCHEKHNFDNPTPFPKSKYLLLNWEKEDFFYFRISKEYILKQERETDNKYKAKARRLWYERQANKI